MMHSLENSSGVCKLTLFASMMFFQIVNIEAAMAEYIIGTNKGETLIGTKHDDVIQALGGNDTIRPGGGRNRVYGGPGSDRLIWEAGDGYTFFDAEDFVDGAVSSVYATLPPGRIEGLAGDGSVCLIAYAIPLDSCTPLITSNTKLLYLKTSTGNDVVTLEGFERSGSFLELDVGPGDDVVSPSGSSPYHVNLGPGNDDFYMYNDLGPMPGIWTVRSGSGRDTFTLGSSSYDITLNGSGEKKIVDSNGADMLIRPRISKGRLLVHITGWSKARSKCLCLAPAGDARLLALDSDHDGLLDGRDAAVKVRGKTLTLNLSQFYGQEQMTLTFAGVRSLNLQDLEDR